MLNFFFFTKLLCYVYPMLVLDVTLSFIMADQDSKMTRLTSVHPCICSVFLFFLFWGGGGGVGGVTRVILIHEQTCFDSLVIPLCYVVAGKLVLNFFHVQFLSSAVKF